MIDLRYFDADEFREWFDDMSPRLLILLDSLRHQWGDSITISPVDGALGRHNGPDDPSQHNIDKHEEVRAADVFLYGMDSAKAANKAVGMATRVGFTGIGVYPHWEPRPGMHLDVRTSERPGEPALWGMVDDGDGQYQVSLDKAMERMG